MPTWLCANVNIRATNFDYDMRAEIYLPVRTKEHVIPGASSDCMLLLYTIYSEK